MTESCDIAIVGGGVVGSAIAYFITADPAFGGSVVVIERDPSYQFCATTRSAGGVRQQYSTPENIEIGKFGAAFVKNAAAHLSVDGEPPVLGFVEGGYLFLASEEGRAVLEANHATQRAHGADVALLDPGQLRARFPWISTEGVALGSLGLSNEGWFDPNALLQGFRRKARAQGARFLHDHVGGIERADNRVEAVRLEEGGRLACGALVNAAGPAAGWVAALAGIELPVRPRRRFVYVFDCRTPIEPRAPLVIDTNGVFFRPETRGFITGVSPEEADDPDMPPYGRPDDQRFDVEYAQFEEIVWPTIAQRVPAFEAIKPSGAWAGHYDYNTFDQNGVVGRHPEVANFLFANGFSGHGLQQSPAVGRAVSELVLHGGYRTIDLTRFGWERIPAGKPLLELNVV
jgi:sarcosine oxidase